MNNKDLFYIFILLRNSIEFIDNEAFLINNIDTIDFISYEDFLINNTYTVEFIDNADFLKNTIDTIYTMNFEAYMSTLPSFNELVTSLSNPEPPLRSNPSLDGELFRRLQKQKDITSFLRKPYISRL